MLKTNEFRINNLLEIEGKIIKIGKIEEKFISWKITNNQKTIWNPFLPITDKRLKPIEITEDWLEKFGFKKIDHHRFKIQPSVYEWYYTYSIHDNAFRFYVEDTIVCLSTIFYIHQLQNLFYALTGSELTDNQICYKSNEICKFNCSGLCRESF